MRERFIEWIVKRAPYITALAILASAFCIYCLFDFEQRSLNIGIDASLDGLLPTSGKDLETYEKVRRQFGGDDILLVAWFDDELFSTETLNALKRFARKARRIDGVKKIDSLATAINVRDDGESIRVERLLQRVPKSTEKLAQIKTSALSNPLYRGQFVSEDGRATLMAVHFDPQLSTTEIAQAVKQVALASKEAAGNIEQFISGPIHARLEISRVMFRDIQRALPLAILLTALIAALAFRSIHGVFLPLFATGLGLSLSLVAFAAAGHSLNFVTAIAPPVIFVVGFAFAMHVVSEFDRHYGPSADKEARLKSTIGEVFTPLTLTAVTTTIGFGSLATSPISSIRIFGIYTALGTSLCWLTALIVIPAILKISPIYTPNKKKRNWLADRAPLLATFDTKYKNYILGIGALIALLGIALATRIEVSTDYLSNFSADSEVRQHFDQIKETFNGAIPLQILIRSEVQDAFTDPIQLATLNEFEYWLEEQAEIGAASTLIDFIGIINTAFNSGDARASRIPNTRGEIEDLLFLAGGDEIERFVDPRYQQTLLHVRTTAVSSRDLADLISRLEERLNLLPAHLHGEVTGSSALLARTLDSIVYGQLTSLAGALLVIYLILIVLFGSASVGAIALIPNVLPIICFFGLLGLTGVTLNLATSLVAAVVLGIAVDDTMHFLSRFNTEAKRQANEQRGIEAALTSVIRPVTFTTAALCCGFATLIFGELGSQIEFGALAAITLLIAWIIDLIFTPALAGKLRFVTLWEVLTVDLGTSPHKTIPLFAGMSIRQARIAAILGNIVKYEAGDHVMKLGDQGHDFHLIIDGTAVAYLNRPDGQQTLRELKRGDLIGEVAFYEGVRTANVDATTTLRLLHLDYHCLENIYKRYPRISALLYRNLGSTLAQRLTDVTSRL